MSKLIPLEKAWSIVRIGDTITVSGISIHRNPMAFIKFLVDYEYEEMGFIDREPGVAWNFS